MVSRRNRSPTCVSEGLSAGRRGRIGVNWMGIQAITRVVPPGEDQGIDGQAADKPSFPGFRTLYQMGEGHLSRIIEPVNSWMAIRCFLPFKKEGEKNPEDAEFVLSKESLALVQEWADEEGISVEDVISKGISMYEIVRHFREQGLALASINDEWEVQAKLTIPGFTTGGRRSFSRSANKPQKVR